MNTAIQELLEMFEEPNWFSSSEIWSIVFELLEKEKDQIKTAFDDGVRFGTNGINTKSFDYYFEKYTNGK